MVARGSRTDRIEEERLSLKKKGSGKKALL